MTEKKDIQSIRSSMQAFAQTVKLYTQIATNTGYPPKDVKKTMEQDGWRFSIDIAYQAATSHEPSLGHIQPHIINPQGEEMWMFDKEYINAVKNELNLQK